MKDKTDENEGGFRSKPRRKVKADSAAFATEGTFGLTKREYFAGKAMQGMLSNDFTLPALYKQFGKNECLNYLAKDSIEAASALIRELDK